MGFWHWELQDFMKLYHYTGVLSYAQQFHHDEKLYLMGQVVEIVYTTSKTNVVIVFLIILYSTHKSSFK